jgi:hypothetical protein
MYVFRTATRKPRHSEEGTASIQDQDSDEDEEDGGEENEDGEEKKAKPKPRLSNKAASPERGSHSPPRHHPVTPMKKGVK